MKKIMVLAFCLVLATTVAFGQQSQQQLFIQTSLSPNDYSTAKINAVLPTTYGDIIVGDFLSPSLGVKNVTMLQPDGTFENFKNGVDFESTGATFDDTGNLTLLATDGTIHKQNKTSGEWTSYGEPMDTLNSAQTLQNYIVDIGNNTYFIAGHMTYSGTTLVNHAYTYNTTTNTIVSYPVSAAVTSVSRSGSKIYVTYGPALSDRLNFKIFNLTTLAYDTLTATPPNTILLAQSLVHNDTVYVFGLEFGTLKSKIWSYINNTWSTIGRVDNASIHLSYDGTYLHVAGLLSQMNGQNCDNVVSYNESTGAWSNLFTNSGSDMQYIYKTTSGYVAIANNGAFYSTTIAPNGINDPQSVQGIRMYPNPTNNHLTISGATGTIIITDLIGNTILTTEAAPDKGETSINLPVISNGIYLVHAPNFSGKIAVNQ